MRTYRRSSRWSIVAAALLVAAPAAAQQQGASAHANHPAAPTSGYRAELLRDVATLESRYLGLADAMKGKYGWSPAQGVRSVGAVFAHIASANLMIPGALGVQAPAGFTPASAQALEKAPDEAKVKAALRESFAHVRHAISSVPDDQLDATTKLFGRDSTKRAVLHLLVAHMHEHLGQSIAYARSNGVTPPWSGGGAGD